MHSCLEAALIVAGTAPMKHLFDSSLNNLRSVPLAARRLHLTLQDGFSPLECLVDAQLALQHPAVITNTYFPPDHEVP